MKKIYYPQLDETVYQCVLPSGLQVIVLKRPGFTRKLAYLATDYGALHTHYTYEGKAYTAPEGVAHYLEHKMFDMPGGRDVSAEFAALGANVNAFTSYDMTAYHFSCTENFEAALQLLLEFVTTPYFTPETVEKERGIITQEIAMNEDNPDTQVFERLMQLMYQKHPVRHPILGTRESIGNITDEVLHQCHRAFYAPENMLLCVVGDVDETQVAQLAQKAMPEKRSAGVHLTAWPEEMTCPEKQTVATMEVAMPMFQIGFKAAPMEKGENGVIREVVGDLAAEVLFGESSQLYLQMYEEGLIDSAFGGGFENVEGMAFLTACGDSDAPEKVRDAILRRVGQLVQEGIDENVFLRMKRSALGRRIRSLDSFDSTCFRICAYHFSGFDYFRFPEIYEKVTVQQVLAFLQEVVTEERCAMSVIQAK